MASLIVHGGAGSMKGMNQRRLIEYRSALSQAASAGGSQLGKGGNALNAVIAAVRSMEDSGVFNAGLGAVLTLKGEAELDAAVMTGENQDFGAVASVTGVRSPVELARRVMNKTPHCILSGEGARLFARQQGLEVSTGYPTEAQLASLQQKIKEADSEGGLDAMGLAAAGAGLPGVAGPAVGEGDTVGAVAIDDNGELAAAVSTGGLWLKMPGRVGDSPLPGAGIWIDPQLGAAVGTGAGELIMRSLLCKEAVDAMGQGAQAGCNAAIEKMTARFGPGSAGVIGISATGDIGFALNTRGMGRSVWDSALHNPNIAVWHDQEWRAL